MSNAYRQYRKNQVELFERFEKAFDDMVKYDEDLFIFTPSGSYFSRILSDEEIKERKNSFDKFLAEYKPGFEKEMREILNK